MKRFGRRFFANYWRDLVIVLAVFAFVIATTELLIFRVYRPNYFQRISTYFYLLLPVLSLVIFFYYYLKNIRAGIIAPARSIRYRLMMTFILVTLLPSTPVFLLSSDTIKRNLSDYLNLNMESILKLHRRAMLLLLNRTETPATSLSCQSAGERWCTVFRVREGARFRDSETAELYGLYRTYFNQAESDQNPDFFILRREWSGAKNGRDEVFLTEKDVRGGLLMMRLKPGERDFFLEGEGFFRNYLLMTAYQKPIQTSVDIFLAILFIFVLAISIIMAWFLSKRLSAPVISLAEATRHLSTGNFTHTRAILNAVQREKAPAELRTLTESFLSMADELEKYREELYRVQKSEAWKDVARRMAHEIKNPLTPMQLAAQRLLRQLEKYGPGTDERFAEMIRSGSNNILGQISIISRLVDSFSALARLPLPRKKQILPEKLISDFCRDAQDPDLPVTFENSAPGVRIHADREQIMQVLLNLWQNSRYAIRSKAAENPDFRGAIRITLDRTKTAVRLQFQDNGIGIPSDDLAKITRPDFTTRPDGQGLGLAIVHRILEEHDAEFSVESSDGKDGWTRVSIGFRQEQAP